MAGPHQYEWVTKSVDETLVLGARIGERLMPNSVIALIGTLGSGKTHLVKGIARGNRTPPDTAVNSPTFVIVNEYPGTLRLFHIDAYRLSGAAELEALGFDEMCQSDGAVLVEWADRVTDALPPDHLSIEIEIIGESSRRFRFDANRDRSIAMLDGIKVSG